MKILLTWNEKMNLTAIRDPLEHFEPIRELMAAINVTIRFLRVSM